LSQLAVFGVAMTRVVAVVSHVAEITVFFAAAAALGVGLLYLK
jgi:hypothetical protein